MPRSERWWKMVRIKICGTTTYEDAAWAVDCGADALGFNCWPESPRYVRPETGRHIIERLPPFVEPVGVFVNQHHITELEKQVVASGVHTVQLHGDETPAFCRMVNQRWPTIRALRVTPDFDPVQLAEYSVNAVLLDAYTPDQYGGTGKVFEWKLAMRAKQFVAHLILAGGLTAENVGEAIRSVKPYAVDVCSSLERSPGRKDPAKIREFIQAVRSAAGE